MHQSFVAPAPSGPRNSGAFNFSIFKALLKALHCRAKFVVKSPLKAPPPPPPPMGADKIKIKNNNWSRPINRAPLGHTRFYCQGALFPWPDKTHNQFPIQFFIISSRHNSKWFGRYINHILDHAFTLKQNMSRPLIPDSYPFSLPNSIL